jgi:hypothetical protein
MMWLWRQIASAINDIQRAKLERGRTMALNGISRCGLEHFEP